MSDTSKNKTSQLEKDALRTLDLHYFSKIETKNEELLEENARLLEQLRLNKIFVRKMMVHRQCNGYLNCIEEAVMINLFECQNEHCRYVSMNVTCEKCAQEQDHCLRCGDTHLRTHTIEK